jgi:hypothetical protein
MRRAGASTGKVRAQRSHRHRCTQLPDAVRGRPGAEGARAAASVSGRRRLQAMGRCPSGFARRRACSRPSSCMRFCGLANLSVDWAFAREAGIMGISA